MANRTISVSVPEEMLPDLDKAARRERCSRPQLIRELLRRYLSVSLDRMIPLADAKTDEIEAIRRGREELARGDWVRLEDLQHELGLPTK